MSKKKVLIVTQEMQPYTAFTQIAEIAHNLPKDIQESGMEIRVLMPRFGTINERRHRLHEVVRLSGMNIIVDDDDFPLIIKVASLPGARMQVYFLDNEDFFKRKYMFEDESGKPYEDNAERMVFFCKGVLETVKKFGWPPDIVHCHGWMTSLVPLYLKTAYRNEPLFRNARVVYSVYNSPYEKNFGSNFADIASINNLKADDLVCYQNGSGAHLHKGALHYADGVVLAGGELSQELSQDLIASGKPVLNSEEAGNNSNAYLEFYGALLGQEVEEEK